MKEAYYFPHDANARTDAKILELRAEMGWEGYGLWWALVEQMREAGDYKLSNTLIGGLAMGLAIPKDKLRTMLDLCISVGLLAIEGDCFYSPSLRRRLVALDNKRLARVESARNAAEKRWQSAGNADAMRTHSEGIAQAMRIDATIEESKLDLTKPNETKEELSSLRSEDAAIAADGEQGKKIGAETLQLEIPADASHTRGAADVPTRKRPASKKPKATALQFEDSPYADPLVFAAAMAGTDYEHADLSYYHEYIKNWANSKAATYTDWLAMMRNWMLRDAKAGQLKTASTSQQATGYDHATSYRTQNGAAGYGQRPASAVHANPFGIASPQSLAIAGALASGGHRDYSDLI